MGLALRRRNKVSDFRPFVGLNPVFDLIFSFLTAVSSLGAPPPHRRNILRHHNTPHHPRSTRHHPRSTKMK